MRQDRREEREKGKSGRENYSRFYIVGAHKLLWSRARESLSASVLLPTRCFFPPLYECEEARWKQIPFYYKPAKFMFEQKKCLEFFSSSHLLRSFLIDVKKFVCLFFFLLFLLHREISFHCIIHDNIRQPAKALCNSKRKKM